MIRVLVLIATFTGLVEAEEPDPNPYCGLNTLYVSLKALDAEVASVEELKKKLGSPPSEGFSLGQLAEVAEGFSLHTLGVKTTAANLELRRGRFACIAHVGGSHFLNIGQIGEGFATIIDPPRSYELPLSTLESQWDGKALLISREPLASEEDLGRYTAWTWFFWLSSLTAVILGLVYGFRRRSGVA